MQGEFHLTDVQNGILPAAFILGLVVASIVYSELAKTYNAFRLIGAPNLLAHTGADVGHKA